MEFFKNLLRRWHTPSLGEASRRTVAASEFRVGSGVGMDGEYDIFGNPVSAAPAAAAESSSSSGGGGGDLASNAPTTSQPTTNKLFEAGDKCEVKEGGTKYRAATVIKFDEGIGALDVQYSDGEKECGIPVNLVRKSTGSVEREPKSKVAPPVQQQRPVDYAEEAKAPPLRRRNKGSKEVARQIYDLVKNFSDQEQAAALQMLQALDSVRASGPNSEQ